MDKKIVDQLVQQSITGTSLDEKKVIRIADQLNRNQLKIYIDGLKRWRQKNTVIIESAANKSEQVKREFKDAFEGKNVVFITRPELIVGTRIINYDMIYEMNLKDTLQNMQQYIQA